MGRKAGLLTAIAALCAALPAAAQSEPAGDVAAESDNTIVVTSKGQEPDRDEVADQARELSRVGPYQAYDEALPRFETPVCPAVLGLREDYAAQMTERVRANAARLQVPLAKANCSPNLTIAFVDDGQNLLTRFAARFPKIFCIIPEAEQTELLSDSEPVRVWSHIRTIDLRHTGAPARIWRCREDIPSQGGKTGMFLPERRDIISSLVVFDREEVVGLTLEQLADYATMRGLAHTRPAAGNEAMQTILALFEGDRSSPAELTSFDVGYLESLYHFRPDQRAMTRFLSIKRRAEKAAAVGAVR